MPDQPVTLSPNSSLKLSLGAIVSICIALMAGVGSLVGGAVQYSSMQIEVRTLRAEVNELREQNAKHEEKDRLAELHFQRLDSAIEAVRDMNARLEAYTNRVNILLYKSKLLQADGSFR